MHDKDLAEVVFRMPRCLVLPSRGSGDGMRGILRLGAERGSEEVAVGEVT